MQGTAPQGTDAPSGRHRSVKRRRWGVSFLLLLVVLIAAGGVAAARYYDWCREASGPREPVTFEVERGTSGSEIVDSLHDRGVLRCALVSRWELRRRSLEDELRSGSFELTTNMELDEVLVVLTTPPEQVPTMRLTIPEGYRLTQIAERVREELRISSEQFNRAVAQGDWSLPPYLPDEAESVEGFLFPETYEFRAEGTTATDVIDRLIDQFGAVAEDLPWDNAEALGVTPYEVVTIASMIEEEARVAEERAVIAGVIYNRLQSGMTLGIDATLLYDDPTPDGQLSFSDLEYDSPYNTRIYGGLPPTPISSPGLASLQAALEPAETEFFFYVLCGEDGHHEFAVTNAEHEQNRARCGE
jgi:UPF0755 protein